MTQDFLVLVVNAQGVQGGNHRLQPEQAFLRSGLVRVSGTNRGRLVSRGVSFRGGRARARCSCHDFADHDVVAWVTCHWFADGAVLGHDFIVGLRHKWLGAGKVLGHAFDIGLTCDWFVASYVLGHDIVGPNCIADSALWGMFDGTFDIGLSCRFRAVDSVLRSVLGRDLLRGLWSMKTPSAASRIASSVASSGHASAESK